MTVGRAMLHRTAVLVVLAALSTTAVVAAGAAQARDASGWDTGIGTEAARTGPLCDAATGKIMIPSFLAAVCVRPWPDGATNGGALVARGPDVAAVAGDLFRGWRGRRGVAAARRGAPLLRVGVDGCVQTDKDACGGGAAGRGGRGVPEKPAPVDGSLRWCLHLANLLKSWRPRVAALARQLRCVFSCRVDRQ